MPSCIVGEVGHARQRPSWSWLARDAHQLEVVRWIPAEMRSPAGRRGVVERFERAFARRP